MAPFGSNRSRGRSRGESCAGLIEAEISLGALILGRDPYSGVSRLAGPAGETARIHPQWVDVIDWTRSRSRSKRRFDCNLWPST